MIPIWTHFLLLFSTCIFLIKFITVFKDLCTFLGSSLVILWTSWQLTIITRRKFRKEHVDPVGKAVIVTGCDSGFGNMLAHQLSARGFTVYACCLFPKGPGSMSLLAKECSNIHVVSLDVTSAEEVEEAVTSIDISLAKNHERLWALVNNAGVITCGEIEWGDLSSFERMLQVNVIGMVRMTRACLPLLRRDKGRVVNMGSVSQRFCAPGFAAYSMSKSAVGSFTSGLRRELLKWDIKVVEIEPDAYKTPMATETYLQQTLDSCWEKTRQSVKFDYGLSYYDVFKSYLVANLKTARKYPEEVVSALEEAVVALEPNIKYLCCGPHNRLIIWLFDFLPCEWLEFLVKFYVVSQKPESYGRHEANRPPVLKTLNGRSI